jgi:signal transduction histidine kinase
MSAIGRPGRWRPGPGAGGRLIFAVLLGAVQLVGTLLVAPLQPDRAAPGTPQAAVLLLAGPATLIVTRAPVVRAIVATAAAAAYLAVGYPVGPVLLGAGLALVLAVQAGRQIEAWLVAAAGLVGAVTASRFGGVPVHLLPALQWAGWAVALLALAELFRAHRDAAQAWSRARAQLRLRQAGEERAAIVRDLHDEAAHRLHLIQARVAAALPVLDAGAVARATVDRATVARSTGASAGPLPLTRSGLPEARSVLAALVDARTAPVDATTALAEARTALMEVREAGDRALAELRAAGDVLTSRGETVPQPEAPGLAALTELAAQWAGAGLLVRAAGDPGPLPPDVDQAAYRVIQEALANVARHSCARHADLALHRDVDQLTVLVSDAGPPRAAPAGPSAEVRIDRDDAASGDAELLWPPDGDVEAGLGLLRMHERVAALGGAVSAGPDGDGWCVHVVLPAGPTAWK